MTGQFPKVKMTAEQVAQKLVNEEREVNNEAGARKKVTNRQAYKIRAAERLKRMKESNEKS